MLEVLLLAVGIAGFGMAGYLDLRTTEFPDYLPYAMITLALLLRGVFSLMQNDFSLIINSVIVGGLFLGFGLALYHLKQWGDGDAWLLGAMGFLFPDTVGFSVSSLLPFPAVLIFNFFFISFVYLIFYSVALGWRHSIFGAFFRHLKTKSKEMAVILAACFSFFAALVLMLGSIPHTTDSYTFLLFPSLLFFMSVFVYYGRFVEQRVFRRKIPVNRLRIGDVPADMRWKVINRKELAALKRKGGSIWIKEGVRFAPVFLITLIVTFLFGSLFI